MNRDAPGGAEDTNDFGAYRRIILSLIIALVLVQPAVHLLQHPVTASGWFQLATAAIFGRPDASGPRPQPPVPVPGPAARATVHRPRAAFTGSGLTGLTERVRGLGGELAAGLVEPHGFLLRVVVPLSPQA